MAEFFLEKSPSYVAYSDKNDRTRFAYERRRIVCKFLDDEYRIPKGEKGREIALKVAGEIRVNVGEGVAYVYKDFQNDQHFLRRMYEYLSSGKERRDEIAQKYRSFLNKTLGLLAKDDIITWYDLYPQEVVVETSLEDQPKETIPSTYQQTDPKDLLDFFDAFGEAVRLQANAYERYLSVNRLAEALKADNAMLKGENYKLSDQLAKIKDDLEINDLIVLEQQAQLKKLDAEVQRLQAELSSLRSRPTLSASPEEVAFYLADLLGKAQKIQPVVATSDTGGVLPVSAEKALAVQIEESFNHACEDATHPANGNGHASSGETTEMPSSFAWKTESGSIVYSETFSQQYHALAEPERNLVTKALRFFAQDRYHNGLRTKVYKHKVRGCPKANPNVSQGSKGTRFAWTKDEGVVTVHCIIRKGQRNNVYVR